MRRESVVNLNDGLVFKKWLVLCGLVLTAIPAHASGTISNALSVCPIRSAALAAAIRWAVVNGAGLLGRRIETEFRGGLTMLVTGFCLWIGAGWYRMSEGAG